VLFTIIISLNVVLVSSMTTLVISMYLLSTRSTTSLAPQALLVVSVSNQTVYRVAQRLTIILVSNFSSLPTSPQPRGAVHAEVCPSIEETVIAANLQGVGAVRSHFVAHHARGRSEHE